MRALCLLILLSGPATAWEFSPTPVCTLSHSSSSAELVVTYDPTLELPYALTTTRREPWTGGETFAIEFRGTAGFDITTTRHVISPDGLTLRVEDSGFGNVLNGLEYNDLAIASLGASSEKFSLDTAAQAVQAFRKCPSDLTS